MSRVRWFDLACFVVFSAASSQAYELPRSVVDPPQNSGSNNGTVPIQVINQCEDTIWPGIVTQGGEGTRDTGFALTGGSNHTVYVSDEWQGRVWGRTNCSFNDQGEQGQCTTGECGQLACAQAGNPPATLAEFTLNGAHDQAFYDISLVDGYNLPLAIVLLPLGNSNLAALDPATTNPSCVASVGDLAAQNFNPYSNGQQFLGTNSSNPLAFDTKITASDVSSWCPWDLQVDPPTAPGDGVYPYPDGNVARPAFDPCLSACAKYNEPKYCCTGSYNSPSSCGPNYYSKAAKSVCPDAYSYAYDDSSSTFSIPTGGGFRVIFCPGGRSTNILATEAGKSSSSSSVTIPAIFTATTMVGGAAKSTVLLGLWTLILSPPQWLP